MGRFQYTFPKWTNLILPMVIIVGMTAPLYVAFMVAWGFSPTTTDVGYMPTQPVPFSHRVHAGELGIDCRYCHNTVEYAAVAAIPPTATCMNCHDSVLKDDPRLEPIRVSYFGEDTNRDGKVAKEEAKAVLAAEAKKRAASRKKPAKPSVKKPSTKKPSSDVAKKATESRAKFLQRFDANRDGKVTKEETKAVLAAEAKKRAAAREKKKR